MSKETKPETVEVKINKFVEEFCNKTKEETEMITIGIKMSLVSMKNKDKYEEFRLGLRKAGYII